MILTSQLSKKIGVLALAMIEESIDKGVDIDGNAYHYSEKPFFMPWNSNTQRKLGGRNGEGVFYDLGISRRTGTFGFIILGGYKAYKEKVNPEAADDFLVWSGKMLRGLKVIEQTEGSVTIGWSDPQLARRAFWLNISGAGRSRKLWKFLGLRREQQKHLAEMLTPDVRDIVVSDLAKRIRSITN